MTAGCSHRAARLAIAAALLLPCAAAIAFGQQSATPPERDRAAAAARRGEERLRALRREADALVAQERTLLTELRKLEVDRQIAVEQLATLENQRAELTRRIEDAEARAAALAKAAEAQRPDVEGRLVELYKRGRAGYWRLLLNVQDLRDLGRAYRAVATLTAMDRARVAEHYATLDALARERKALHDQAAELERLHAEATRARAAADRAVTSRSALIASIDSRRDLNAQLISELQAAQQKLQSSVGQLDTGRPPAVLPVRAFQGELPWPARGTVVGRFGKQPSSRYGTAIARNGVEIAVEEGQIVRNVHEGTVAFADRFAGYGNLVIVDHGGRAYSLYGYLGSLGVSQGQRLDALEAVGTAGRSPTGNPALYFELRVDGVAVDPLQWLKNQP